MKPLAPPRMKKISSSNRKRKQANAHRCRCSVQKIIGLLMSIVFVGYVALVYSTLSSKSSWSISETATSTAVVKSSSLPSTKNKKKRFAQNFQKSNNDPIITIGIASTISNCGPDPFTEGAAVLKYSIDLTSASSSSSQSGGKYDYEFYIMYHPDALQCVLPLQDLGFHLLERPTPVNVSDIQGDILRERIENNGCCGERELIKLEAYRLTQHPVVIHLDLDVLVLKPMDPIIDLMLHPTSITQEQKDVIMWWKNQTRIPNDIQLLYTKDYNVVAPKRKDKPFQGGFFVIKPSLETYNRMVQTVIAGDYRDEKGQGKGWGGIVGPFHGGMTIQGLLPWYYEYMYPGHAVELNRCIYNNIADNPTTERSVNDQAVGKCRTNQAKCEDCRKTSISDIVVFHYPVCLKPWTCVPQKKDVIGMRLCRKAHHEWFLKRSQLEQSWGRNGFGPATNFDRDHFLGYCNSTWSKGYIPIEQPYGKPIESSQ